MKKKPGPKEATDIDKIVNTAVKISGIKDPEAIRRLKVLFRILQVKPTEAGIPKAVKMFVKFAPNAAWDMIGRLELLLNCLKAERAVVRAKEIEHAHRIMIRRAKKVRNTKIVPCYLDDES